MPSAADGASGNMPGVAQQVPRIMQQMPGTMGNRVAEEALNGPGQPAPAVRDRLAKRVNPPAGARNPWPAASGAPRCRPRRFPDHNGVTSTASGETATLRT